MRRRDPIEAFCGACGKALRSESDFRRELYRTYRGPYGKQTWEIVLCHGCAESEVAWTVQRMRADQAIQALAHYRPTVAPVTDREVPDEALAGLPA